MSDTNVVSQVGNSVEFSFNAILARLYNYLLFKSNQIFSTIASISTSIQVEHAQSMKCSVSQSLKLSTSFDLQNDVMPILNETFKLTSDDIRLISDEN